jgi:hypothetical protein
MMPDARRRRPPLLGNLESTSTFKRFREGVEKATIGLAIPVRPTAHYPAENSAPPTVRNFVKFHMRFSIKYVHTFWYMLKTEKRKRHFSRKHMYKRNNIAPLLIFITEEDCVLCEVRAEVDKQLSNRVWSTFRTLQRLQDSKYKQQQRCVEMQQFAL